MRAQRAHEGQLRLFADLDRPQVVDLFAGGGGASTGIEQALGVSPFLAVNHDETAISIHRANHPTTEHRCESVYAVDPIQACRGRRVDLLWASPDCTHFSRAKGGKPRKKNIRGLAWVVVEWARAVRPRVIMVENVPEFADWGPLTEADQPDEARKGETFALWRRQLEAEGYVVEHRVLVAADYGAPTTRRRLFVVARRDGEPIRWPEPTHGEGRAHPWRSAGECVDWSIPFPSIFDRPKPLADATCRRIAHGLVRYVLHAERPYLVPPGAAWLIHHRGQSVGRAVDEPCPTITATGQGHLGLVAAFLSKHYGGVVGHGLERPVGTITATDHHGPVVASLAMVHTGNGEREGQAPRIYDPAQPLGTIVAGGQKHGLVAAFLAAYYGSERDGQGLDRPIRTIPSVDRFGVAVVAIDGQDYAITDIGFRMMQPSELLIAQGFPADYDLSPARTKRDQVKMIGNSVPPQFSRALVEAQR
jgi:DNA (cytosine-5)-methyltransferase 1